MDSAALTSAWERVFNSMAVDDLDAYLAQGWMTAECVMKKTGVTISSARAQLQRLAKMKELESKKIRTIVGGIARQLCIYRPRS